MVRETCSVSSGQADLGRVEARAGGKEQEERQRMEQGGKQRKEQGERQQAEVCGAVPTAARLTGYCPLDLPGPPSSSPQVTPLLPFASHRKCPVQLSARNVALAAG